MQPHWGVCSPVVEGTVQSEVFMHFRNSEQRPSGMQHLSHVVKPTGLMPTRPLPFVHEGVCCAKSAFSPIAKVGPEPVQLPAPPATADRFPGVNLVLIHACSRLAQGLARTIA